MQIHPPSPLVGNGEFPVRLHGGSGDPFAIMEVDPDGSGTTLFMESPGDCDRLDRANARARALLLAAPIPDGLVLDGDDAS